MLASVFTPVNVTSNIDETQRMIGGETVGKLSILCSALWEVVRQRRADGVFTCHQSVR